MMDGTVRTNEETENKESYIVSSVLVEQVVNLNKEGHNKTNARHYKCEHPSKQWSKFR